MHINVAEKKKLVKKSEVIMTVKEFEKIPQKIKVINANIGYTKNIILENIKVIILDLINVEMLE